MKGHLRRCRSALRVHVRPQSPGKLGTSRSIPVRSARKDLSPPCAPPFKDLNAERPRRGHRPSLNGLPNIHLGGPLRNGRPCRE